MHVCVYKLISFASLFKVTKNKTIKSVSKHSKENPINTNILSEHSRVYL